MAGEIYASRDSAETLYVIIFDPSEDYKVYNFSTSAFEVWADGNIGDYDLAMTASGDMHYADFPDLDEGVYVVQVRQQAGASPSVNDFPVSQGRIYWGETAGDDGGGGEVEIEDIVSSNNSIINVFTPAEEEVRIEAKKLT